MRYHFESCTFDLRRGSLLTGSRKVELRPKSFAMLRHLVENPGRLIPKEEIIAAVWPRVVVTDDSLARCISDVRAAIDDNNHTMIKTVPRRGYLFAAKVEREVEACSEDMGAQASAHLSDRASIAVLALTNVSGDRREEYLSDGITEDIITELSRFSELLVIARNSTFQYKGRPTDIRLIGRELGVRYVLEGSVRREENRIRISAQLIDTANGAHRWAERYDRELADLFMLQTELAGTIGAALAVHVNRAEAERTLSKPPSSWHAHDYYLRAADLVGSYHSSFSKGELHEARRLLLKALEIDRSYARVHAALALSYVSSWIHRWDHDCPWRAALDLAYQRASDAVRLAPNLPEAHVSLGYVLSFRRQHEAGIAAFERAIQLNPNFTNWRFPFTLILAGEPARAIEALARHMRLDPFYEPYAPGLLGFACYMLKRYEEGLAHVRECVSRAPNMRLGRLWLAATYVRLGELAKAKAEAAEALRIDPQYSIEGAARLFLPFKHSEDASHLFDTLRKAGIPEDSHGLMPN